MKKQNKLRLNPEELCLKTLQETSWETLLKSTEDKTCFKHKDAHNKCDPGAQNQP